MFRVREGNLNVRDRFPWNAKKSRRKPESDVGACMYIYLLLYICTDGPVFILALY